MSERDRPVDRRDPETARPIPGGRSVATAATEVPVALGGVAPGSAGPAAGMDPRFVMRLQRVAGNAAVSGLFVQAGMRTPASSPVLPRPPQTVSEAHDVSASVSAGPVVQRACGRECTGCTACRQESQDQDDKTLFGIQRSALVRVGAAAVLQRLDPTSEGGPDLAGQVEHQPDNRVVVGRLAAAVQRDPPQPDPMIDRENQAIDRLKGRSGQGAGSFLYGSPVSPRYQPPEKPPSADIKIGALLLRATTDTQPRRGFDTQQEATAYAAVAAGGTGAVVLQDDKLWFAASLGSQPDPTFERKHVYEFTAAAPVIAAIGIDGFVFTSRQYTPEEDQAGLRDRPENDVAHPPDAASLRALVGMNAKPEGDKPRQVGMAVPAGQEEVFLRSYLVSRALEALNENRDMAEKLSAEFKPNDQGMLGPAAKALADKSRTLGTDYQKLEDEETKVGEGALAIQEKHNDGKWNYLRAQGRTQSYFAWVDELNQKFKQIQAGKDAALAMSPLLASMVFHEKTPTTAGDWAAKLGWERSTVRKVATALTWPLSQIVDAVEDSTHGAPSWKDSELSKASSAESDKKVGDEFRTKLDGVQQAISRSIGRVTGGDTDYLLELSGLRSRVQADVDRLGPENQAVKDKYKDMLATHEMKEEAINIAGNLVQIGALFLPGGQFISAAIGMGMALRSVDQHMDQWDASKAAVDPAKALADQQDAVKGLLADTLVIALQAVDLAVSVKGGMEDLEMGRTPKDPEGAPGATDVNAPKPPAPKEPMTVEVGAHKFTWVEGKGLNICVNPCGAARDFLDAYGDQLYVREAREHSKLSGEFVEKRVASAQKHLTDLDAKLAANPPKDVAALKRASVHGDSVLEEMEGQKRFSMLRFPPDGGGAVLSNKEWADSLMKELNLRRQAIEQTDKDFFATLGPDVQARAEAAHAKDLEAKIGDPSAPKLKGISKQVSDEGKKAVPDLNKRAKLMDDIDKALTNYERELRGQRELILSGADVKAFSDEEVGNLLFPGVKGGMRPDYVAESGNTLIIGDSKGAGEFRKAIDQLNPALDSNYVQRAVAAGKKVECRVYLSASEATDAGLKASPTGQLLERVDGKDVEVFVRPGYPLYVVFN